VSPMPTRGTKHGWKLLTVSFVLGLLILRAIASVQTSYKPTEQNDAAAAEEEYRSAQDVVLENLAGWIPESAPYLTVVPRGTQIIRLNQRSGAWCVLVNDPSAFVLTGVLADCLHGDEYAKKIRDQKSFRNRIRHFLSSLGNH
jgi:hypothetical protein